MTNNKISSVLCLLLLTADFSVHAQAPADRATDFAKNKTPSMSAVAPIFSQLLVSTFPDGFVPAFEKANATRYIREAVLRGETVDKWTQMITITGAKDIASNPNVTPQKFVEEIAAGYQRACAKTFNASVLSKEKISGYDAFIAVVGCGRSPLTEGSTSESAMIIAIKGEKDYYTIQWASRDAPTDGPAEINAAKWKERLAVLSPIKLCAKIPGEAAPYPSCIGTK